jgi:hypothetical protein
MKNHGYQHFNSAYYYYLIYITSSKNRISVFITDSPEKSEI